MKLQSSKSSSNATLPDRNFSLAITGAVVDHRGEVAHNWCREKAANCITLKYNLAQGIFIANGVQKTVSQFPDIFGQAGGGNVLVEATTLGFVEIVHCCRSLLENGHKTVTILYVEPLRYSVPHPIDKILLKRDFSLTDVVQPFAGVPGWIRRLTTERKQNIIFFLGFEGERLDQAIEQLIVTPANSSVVFGVPAFRPGWEMNAFANNIERIVESKLRGGVNFCGADNPAAVVDLLQRLTEGFVDSDLFAVPIGTKPHAIGIALFAAVNPKLGLIYDFPERRRDRSESETTWHLFEANFT